MFVHIYKDYLKKLEAVEQRLSVSLDRDEIQTLGLKLRFYYNEIKHYEKLMKDLFEKVVQLQEKYGFVPDDDSTGVEKKKDVRTEAKDEKNEKLVSIVSDWMEKLGKNGVDAKEVLTQGGRQPQKEPQKVEENKSASPEPVLLESAAIPVKKTSIPAIPGNALQSYQRTQEIIEEKSPALVIENSDGSGDVYITSMKPDEYVNEDPDVKGLQMEVPEEETENEEIEAEIEKELEQVELETDESESAEDEAVEEPIREFHDEVDENESGALEERLDAEITDETLVEYKKEEIEVVVEKGFEECLNDVSSMFEEKGALNPDIDAEIKRMSIEFVDEINDNLLEKMTDREDFWEGSESESALYCIAFLFKEVGRSGTAINILEQAWKKAILKDIEVKKLLGDLYYEKEMFQQAGNVYGEIRETKSDDVTFMGKWIRCLKENSDWDGIIAETDMLGDDCGADICILRAEALNMNGRSSEAVAFLIERMGLAESKTEKSIYALILGRLKGEKGDVLGAIDFYEKSFALNPENPEAHFELGKLYLEHKAVPLARNQLLTVVRKFPDSRWAYEARRIMGREGVG
ncbi:MAG TPA: tetratricopeptide repeat protein [bacterium]|nr:tetratricopeptide repeat protein [bacterium]